MVTREAVLDVLRTIDDPEMPISIVNLGIVEDVRLRPDEQAKSAVEVDILPTFVGCPALPVIEEEVRRRLLRMPGVGSVLVHFRFDPPWTVDRISPEGREALRKVGLTVPRQDDAPPGAAAPSCPFCGSSDVRLESPFGPTRCRMIYHCEACHHPFEHLKRVPLPILGGR